MRNYFPKQPSGAPLHTLSKLYYVPVGFVAPPPKSILLDMRSPKVFVDRYRMICLVLHTYVINDERWNPMNFESQG